MEIKGFEYQDIPLKNDYEGECKAVFIEANTNISTRPSVLYIHGFIDYFFHAHVAEFFDQIGYNFYAVELRKYGHSLMSHQHPNYCQSIEEYFEEIDWSINQIKRVGASSIIIMGHSTGGLISSLYLNKGKYKDSIKALILNSPFLEINTPSVLRMLLKPISKFIGDIRPYWKIEGMLPPIYPSSVHKDYEGEWDFDLSLKPINGFPVYFKWSRAIMDTQDWLKVHSKIIQPILLLHSSTSFLPNKHSERVMKSDIVLNVSHMKEFGPRLGINVTMVEIQDGMHDLFLSPKPVRNHALKEVKDWLELLE